MEDKRQTLASREQLQGWLSRFRAYRQPPDEEKILDWLGRFEAEHLPIAHKVLDAVVVVSETEIHEGYKASLDGLPGWSQSSEKRQGRWYFVGVGGAGESGPAMLRMFREANGLTSEKWGAFFVNMRDLPRLNLSALDSVVFVDDFAGSGRQITTYWPTMQELVASEAKCYLLLTAVTAQAAVSISGKTELHLVAAMTLQEKDNVFEDACERFDINERKILEEYGRLAWKAWPKGFGHCGLTLVLSHKTPNNSLPILHANHADWVGLFPRTLIAA